jgi:hypothetical protein
MSRAGVRLAHLRARVVPEKRLNHLLNQTRNKASVLFSTAAQHLDFLLRTYAHHHRLVIFCDRQGGREHYGHLLRLMFEDWPLEIVREDDGYAEYLLHHPPQNRSAASRREASPPQPPPVQLIFREKGETHCMSVAVASMLSKYLREGLMRRFNAFWQMYLPDVTPTAGYYNDGLRFLQDIDATRKQLGIPDDLLVRTR